MQQAHFEVRLPVFEGPFDLLLFFIERDELDIHNIPIAKITGDFLEYMHSMQQLNIELASDFILVAATLMRIKAKMLLPRYAQHEESQEADPREDLVKQLLEYRRFKEAANELKVREEIRMTREGRGNIQQELARIAAEANHNYQGELEALTLFKLLCTFEKVMERFRNNSQNNHHTIIIAPYTVEQQKDFITNLVRSRKRCNFNDIFSACDNKLHAIFNFLALLEMVQSGFVLLVLGDGFNNFWITSPENNFYAN